MSPARRSVLRERDFLKLWAGEGISLMGSQVTELALPLTAVLLLGAGPGEMGLLGAARFAPYLLLTLPAGLFADRHRRRPILVWANLLRAGLIGAVPMLALTDSLSLPVLYLVAFALGGMTVFFDVTFWSYLPAVVKRDQLIEGNSRLMAASSVASVGGPGLGGILVQLLSAPVALAVDAASYLVSAFSLVAIQRTEPIPARTDEGRSIARDLHEGLQTVIGHPVLRSLAATAGAYNLFNAWIEALFVYFAITVLGLSPAAVGFILASSAIGALIGALAAGPAARRIGIGPAVVWAVVVECAAMLPIAFARGPEPFVWAILAGAFFLNGFGVSLSSIQAITLRQTVTPEHLLGRMTATYRFIGYGGIPVGAALGGLAGELLGARGAILLGSLGLLSAVAFVVASPIARLHDVPAPTTPAAET